MTYLTDEEMHALPEGASEAFVAGERRMRERLNEALNALDENVAPDHLTLDYMNNVIALANHFGIEEIACWKNAVPGTHRWQHYSQFAAEVGSCTMGMRLANVRRAKEYSVVLNAATKKKLAHLLSQIRETVEKLEISVVKKDRLYKRINALQDEIDRDRTGFHAFGALAIEVADDAGETAKRLEPVTKMIERIGAALGLAKRTESPPAQLPGPPKRIEGPRTTKDNGFHKSVDDEIPF